MARELTLRDHSIAGALSGFLTRFLFQPLDVLKIRFQLQVEPILWNTTSSKYRSVFQAIKCIYTEEGVKAFWKGHIPAQGLSVVYGTVQFTSFAFYKKTILQSTKNESLAQFVSGGLAGCTCSIVVQPLDLLRTRLVAQGEPKQYKGIIDATTKIMHNEGLRGFYKGLLPTLVQIAPYTGASFSFYLFFKEMFGHFISTEKSGVSVNLISGACAGLVAKTLTYPLDVVKKRLQVQGFEDARKPFGAIRTYSGMMNCFRCMLLEERLRGIYKGLAPSLLKAFFTTSFHFAFYEQSCKFLISDKY